MKTKSRVLVFLGCFLVAGPVFWFPAPVGLAAHPHIWIDTKITLLNDETGIRGVRIEFLFDEGFTYMLLDDVKPSKSGQFEGNALKRVKQDYFDNLENYHYFFYAELNRTALPIPKAADFSAKLEGPRVRYVFTLPLRLSKAASQGKTLSLAVYDDSFYTAVDYDPKQALTISGPPDQVSVPASAAAFQRQKRPDKAFLFGTVVPEYLVLSL